MSERDKVKEESSEVGAYLYALIKSAPWIDESFHALAEKYKKPEVLREIYQCASEGMTIDQVKDALKKRPPEGALRNARQQMITDKMLGGNYKDELSEVKATTEVVKSDIRTLTETVLKMSALIPKGSLSDDLPNDMYMLEEHKETPLLEINETSKKEKVVSSSESEQDQIVESGGSSLVKLWDKFFEKGPSDIVGRMIAEEYPKEQIEYILECFEKNVSVSIIKKLMVKNMPVDVMKRLKNMYEREATKNGKR